MALLRASLDASSEGILLIDPSGRVAVFNEPFLELWNLPRDGVESVHAERLIRLMLERVEDKAQLVRALAESAAEPEAIVRADAELAGGRHLAISSFQRRVGNTGYRVWRFRDATVEVEAARIPRQSAEREAEVTDRSRRLREMEVAFLTAVSHELRTPLAAILGFAETVQESGERLDPAMRSDMLERIGRNARRLDHLLADLIDVDRLARGTLQAYRTATDVGALIRRVVAQGPTIPVGRVRIDAGDVTAFVDASMVERIVETLVANAARFAPLGTPIRVAAAHTGDGLTIRVEDEGPGVPPPYRESIFEPFRQAPGVAEHAPGLGIGLSIVSGLARLHGGRAWVEDREPSGSVFLVVLPDEPE